MTSSEYREHRLSAALRSRVACCWSLEAHGSSGHRVLPDGCMDLLFDVSRGRGFLVGPMRKALVTESAPPVRLFGVRFLPGEAFAFVSLPAVETCDATIPLADVWGAVGERLAEQIAAAPDAAARVAAIDRVLLAMRPRPADARVRHAVRRILAAPAERVAPLGRDVGVSERQLQRMFLERVGQGPKALARVARLQTLLGRLGGVRGTWGSLATHVGYADQAHLAREVKQLTGVTLTDLARAGAAPAWAV